MSDGRVRVLLVDDEASVRLPLKQYLESNFGYQVDAAADSREALHLVQENQGGYDVALIDEVLLLNETFQDDADGIQLMQQIKSRYPDVEAIIFTGWGQESRQHAIQAGAFRYLKKLFDHDELAMVIRTAAQQVRLRAISRGILSEKDPDQVLESITVSACSLALADEAAIVLRDQASGKLGIHSTTYQAGPQWQKHFRDQNLSQEIMQSGQVVRVPDTSQDKRVNPQVTDSGIHAFLGLPIPGEEGNLGVLYVYSQRKGWFEGWGTVAVLQTLAGQAGLALVNAQAFQQIDAHARYMEALVRAGQGLTGAIQLEDQLALAWEFVREQLQVSTFFVALLDREARALHFPLAYDKGLGCTIPEKQEGEGWGVSGYVIESGAELIWATDEEKRQHCQALGIRPIQVGEPCQSCIYLPLRAGDEIIGAISIQSYTPHAFSSVLLDAFRALASQLAVALDNTRLFTELVEAKEWREALIQNAFDAVVAIGQDKKITVFNRQAEEMFGWTAREMLGQTVARLHADVKKVQELFDLVDMEGTVSGWEVELMHQKGDRIPALLSATRIRDRQGRPIGQADFIRDLRQAHLLEDRLRALIRVNQAITETLDLDRVLQLVIESAVAAFPTADGGSIHLYDERTERLHIRANTFGYSPAAVEASHFQPGEGIAGWVFQHGQPTIVDDVESDSRHKAIDHPEIPAHKAMICVPLRVRKRVIGTVSLDNMATTGAFQTEDLGLLSTFADQAAIAIANARRMRETEQMREAAEAMSRALAPHQAPQQIVKSAAQVFQADSAAIWSYDEVRNEFIPEELAAVGIPRAELERFREQEPQPGRTADTVMQRGYLCVTDTASAEYDFLGDPTRELLSCIGIQSFQGIALRLGGQEKLGVLYVNYDRMRTFDLDDEAKLRTFASHAALALKNARLLAQMKRTREAAAVIAGMTVQEDLNQTLQTIAQHARQVLGSDAVSLYAYDEARGQFGGWAADIPHVQKPDSVRSSEELTSGSVVWNILHLAEPPYYCLSEDNADCHGLLGGYFVRAEGIRAAIGIQLRVGEHKMGVMFVNFRSPHRFTSDEIATIQLFADQAAVAVRNAHLYRAMNKLHEGLLRAGQAALEAAEFYPGALQVIVDVVKDISGCDVVTLYVYYEDKQEITYPSVAAGQLLQPEQQPIWDASHPSRRIRLDALDREVILRQLLSSGRSLYASEVAKERLLKKSRFVDREEIKSAAVILLQTGKRTVGILFVNYRSHHTFRSEEQEMLDLFATQAAIAIQNIQHYAELVQAKGLVGARTALAWMGMASSAWRHTIHKHALTICEQAQLLRQDWQGTALQPLKAKAPERLATIERLAAQILEKPITLPLSSEEGVEPIPLNDLVGERARQLWRNDPYRKAKLRLDLKLDDQATVRVSPEWLRRAFDNLVDNAVEAVADCPRREVTIGTRATNGHAEFSVSDTGPGIPQEIQDMIGQKSIERPEDATGLGMGLLMTQAIAQAYGGELRVESSGPTGTTMVIWLPLEKKA